jgi:hypothetical protein
MNTYYFVLDKINEDGTMEIHTEQVEAPDPAARRLTPELADLPGWDGIWRGYVQADSHTDAMVIVAQEY